MNIVLYKALAVGCLSTQVFGAWADNFDSYDPTTPLPDQSTWEAWGGDATAADFYASADESWSPTNSMAIDGPDDAVHQYAGYASGIWNYRANVFVPVAMDDIQYFILVNTYPAIDLQDWSLQLEIDGLAGEIRDFNTGETASLVKGAWVAIQVEINLEDDSQTVYYDGNMLLQKSWSEGVAGGGAVNIAGVDLWANNSAHTVHYDNMSLSYAIGEYHNRALEYLFDLQEWDIGPYATLDDYLALVEALKDFIIGEGFDTSGYDGDADGILASLQSIEAFYESEGETYFGFPVGSEQEAMPYVLDYLETQGVISPMLRDVLIHVNNMAFDPEIPLAEVLYYVQHDLLAMFPSGSDHDVAVLFADVFMHSAEYWNPPPGGSLLPADGDAVILADAAGALYGLLCGPGAAVWSIVEAALFSIIANNASVAAPIDVPGDVTGDGVVDVSDLLVVLASWGECPDPCPPDFDGSGAVDVLDLLVVLGHWS